MSIASAECYCDGCVKRRYSSAPPSTWIVGVDCWWRIIGGGLVGGLAVASVAADSFPGGSGSGTGDGIDCVGCRTGVGWRYI